MTRIKVPDWERLQHIEEYITQLYSLTNSISSFEYFVRDWKVYKLASRLMEDICEAGVNISEETQAQFPQVDWTRMASTRLILAHKYFKV
ncbi:MAG: DUF86 domain-containing protein [Flavobacteriaceae bacterium]|nr:DUF86 domain-containing protein [Flavobacteriaceae bacterium]